MRARLESNDIHEATEEDLMRYRYPALAPFLPATKARKVTLIMKVDFPIELASYIQPGMTARLVAGTYSMGQHRVLPYNGRQINEFSIQFRNPLAEAGRDDFLCTGTLNPSILSQGTNQIVLLIVDIPKASNVAQQFLNFQTNKFDGGSAVVACWCPDGGAGRFLVEQENYCISGWLMSAGHDLKHGLTLLLGILGFTFGTCVVGMVVPCLMFAIVPVAGFFFIKWMQSQKSKGKLLDLRATQDVLQKWAISLTETGTFRSKLNQAFTAPSISSTRL